MGGQVREEHWWGVKMIDTCPNHDCLGALQMTLYSTLGGLLLGQLSQLISPYLKLKAFSWLQTKALEAKYGPVVKKPSIAWKLLAAIGLASQPTEPAPISAGELPKLSFCEQQGLMQEYGVDEQISDFQSLALTLSYVLLFSGVTPLLGIIALPVFLLRLRVDAWKMTVLLRRPFPYIMDGIGPWNVLIDTLMWMGLVCSVSIPLLNMGRFDEFDWFQKLFTFLVIERFLFIVKIITSNLLPEKSADVQLLLDRQQYVLERLRGITQRSKGNVSREPRFVGTVSARIDLDRDFVDWELDQEFSGDDYV